MDVRMEQFETVFNTVVKMKKGIKYPELLALNTKQCTAIELASLFSFEILTRHLALSSNFRQLQTPLLKSCKSS